ncbi:hypothetical protein CH564_005860 [Haemophilus influenzae]|uniref:BRO-N domain-containing protein n=1 Tax=Haemophilus influenzae TaxID=727 RepID=UPI00200AC7AA|nr:BRO family protein [Haemophilus influenzae]MCK9647892.1 hypothetical protein [Haemophilus influenzae]
MTTLTFQNTTLSVINQHNQTYITASDLGNALEYSHPIQNVTKIYERNADEFTAEMTALIEMPTAGGLQKVRIFSLRGAHLIAMFARTKVAKAFRKWVLDVLDKETNQPQQLALPMVNDDFKQAMAKMVTYASQYANFQQAIIGAQLEDQKRLVEFFFPAFQMEIAICLCSTKTFSKIYNRQAIYCIS